MLTNDLSTVANTTQQSDMDISWSAYLWPTVTAVVITGLTLAAWLYRRLKPIEYSPPALQTFQPELVPSDMISILLSQHAPVFDAIVKHIHQRRDALSLSQLNRVTLKTRFLFPLFQSLHIKTVEQLERFVSYCREAERSFPQRLEDLESIRTLSLNFSDKLSVYQSLPLFRYLTNITSLKIRVSTDWLSVATLDLLFTALQAPQALKHLSIDLFYVPDPSREIIDLPASLWTLTSLESLELCNLSDTAILSEEIGQLQALKTLKIYHMLRLRQLPNSISNLKKLETLTLSYLPVERIPDGIGRLPALTSLELAHLPCLTGLPDIAALKQLTRLVLLSLPYLNTLPDFGTLNALKSLRLDRIRAGLPQNVWELGSLQKLELYDLPAVAEIPDDIQNLTALSELKIYGLPVHRLPETLWQLPRLQTLVLAEMRNLQEISARIGALQTLTSLTAIYLPKLSELPPELFFLPRLEKLDVGGLKPPLSEFSEEMARLNTLKSLTLMEVSPLPEGIWQLANLQELVLVGSALTSIPEQIGQLQALTSLELAHLNNIHSLPEALGRLNNLTEIRLSRMPEDLDIPQALQGRVKVRR